MKDSYMGAIQKYELSSEDCSQGAGRLLNGLEIVVYPPNLGKWKEQSGK